MSNFEKAFKKIVEEEGRKERENGMQRGIRKTIKGLLTQNVADEIIINATGISKKELEKLKLQVV